MKIALGCDHGAYLLKNKVADHLRKAGYEVMDFGTNGPESRDAPDFAAAAARAVASGDCETGSRCALLSDVLSAKLTRLHNDTNMMALGAGIVGENLALEIVDTWVSTPFSGEPRHQRRIDKVMALEKE